jgi:hypothetical protein
VPARKKSVTANSNLPPSAASSGPAAKPRRALPGASATITCTFTM